MTSLFVESLISGITLGAVYAVIAMGLCLVYGVSKIFNFCHGTMFTLGAYFAWLCINRFHLNYGLTFLIVLPVMFGIGLALERIVIHPLRWKSDWQFTTIVATLGVAILLENMIQIVFNPRTKMLPPILEGTAGIGGYVISRHEVIIFFVAILTIVLTQFYLTKAKTGMAVRAVSQDTEGAQIVGIRVDRLFSYTFGISVVMAAIGGILMAPKFYITPSGGWVPLIKGFIIVCFGGLGSIPGTLYAAFILGIFEAMVSLYIGPLWVFPFWTLLFILILSFKPRGLLGAWG
ncbi:MAG: branched-chain amino acid ABC transporter permease [Deltaproteobacteria bacterium]|nr:branched-chain amino acid ABC transporter permease [Deltaproteobacteria bacterium]